MDTHRSTLVLASLGLAFASIGCSRATSSAPTTDPAAATAEPAATVVRNVDAKPGDTTTCPYSGKTFVVKADHPRVEYQGQQYWICSEQAAESVRADPAHYLDGFEG